MIRKYQNKTERRRQIIDAARKVIIKYGSEHVTVKRIAKEVGFTEAAIYRHFKSKKEVLSVLTDQILENLMIDISAYGQKGHESSLQFLEAALRGHLSTIEQKRGTSFQVIAEIISLGDKRLNRKASEAISEYVRRLEGLLSCAVAAGEISKEIDLQSAATLLFAMMQGLVNIWALSNYSFNLEEKYQSLWRIFAKAIATRELHLVEGHPSGESHSLPIPSPSLPSSSF